jgi:hypothetical protein
MKKLNDMNCSLALADQHAKELGYEGISQRPFPTHVEEIQQTPN